jgi:cell division protein FtsL
MEESIINKNNILSLYFSFVFIYVLKSAYRVNRNTKTTNTRVKQTTKKLNPLILFEFKRKIIKLSIIF